MSRMSLLGCSLAFAVVLGLLVDAGPLQAQAEPYAPVYPIPEGLESQEHVRQQQQRIADLIPSISEVGVPPYPGAVVFLVHPEEEVRQMIGTGGFAEIKLLTSDATDRIVGFFAEQLPGWHFHEDYMIFWDGQPEFSLQRLMEGKPHITIQPAGAMIQRQIPDAEHMISIVYRTGSAGG